MTQKKFLLFPFLWIPVFLWGQGEVDTQKKIFYRNERSVGLLLNSTGFGASFRYGAYQDDRNKSLWEADLVTLKHPKEVKNPFVYNYTNSRSFYYGKLNTVVNLRGMKGHQYEMFRKIDRGGIAIRYFYGAGVSMALYKPVYYDIYVLQGPNIVDTESKKFDPSIHWSQYSGRSSFFKGINETKVLPGISARAGINFEYSSVDEIIHALELGMVVDAYPKRVPIMAETKNPYLFLSLFVSYRFGRILDPLKGKQWMENKGGSETK